MSDTIDAVAASFAASLALAGGGMLDVSHRSSVAQRKKSVFYMLVKPLTPKQVDPSDLHQTFKRIWTLTGKFKVQSKSRGLFLFAFDLRKDRNRVLWGGPWYYFRSPMVIHEYDGLDDFDDIKMDALFFWVRIEKIPPKLELPEIIEDAAIVAGDNPHVDKELLESKGEVRVRVSHALDRPFIFEKVLKLSPTVIKNVLFSYENLFGLCDTCNLVYHSGGVCKLKKVNEKVVPPKENRVESLTELLNPARGSMVFSAAKPGSDAANMLPSKSSVPVVTRKPMIHKKPDNVDASAAKTDSVAATAAKPGSVDAIVVESRTVLGLVDTNLQVTSADIAVVVPSKDDLLVPEKSDEVVVLDKENAALPPSGQSQEIDLSKRPRSPQAPSVDAVYTRSKEKKTRGLVRFGPATLGMMNGPNDCLILKEAVGTKKRGRTLGSKNRKPTKAQLEAASKLAEKEKAGQVVLQYLLNGKPQDPSVKGKEIVTV